MVGGGGDFAPQPGKAAKCRIEADDLIAKTDGAAMRLKLDDKVTALSFGITPGNGKSSRIVLAVARVHGGIPVRSVLTELGADADALSAEARICQRSGMQ